MADSKQKEFAVELCIKAAKVLGHHGNGEFNFQEVKDVALLIVEEKRASLFPLQDDLSNSMYKSLQKVKREIEKL
tara:strand:+ start:123 stop:347 length:225 start_codon:yes stop_codon:yes gene_type:complete